jgi:probable non-F420 flavinoid oxidoreductase
MATFGFHASHELFTPSELLRQVKLAEAAGFQAAMCSDHFHPWTERQGHSGFAWSWLGAAMEATELSFGTVCAPGQRYHPAVIAQAAATLAQMYPDRFWLAVGSGEALNEKITGGDWPKKSERNSRLMDAVAVLRALWRGETVNHLRSFRVQDAKLYTRPNQPPLIIGAALTPETARWMGPWTDGLITAGSSREALRSIADAYREGGGDGKPLMLQAAICHGSTDAEALAVAHDLWRHAALDAELIADLPTPVAFDAATRHVRPQELASRLRISSDIAKLFDEIVMDTGIGFDRVYIHYIGRQVTEFIEKFGKLIRP